VIWQAGLLILVGLFILSLILNRHQAPQSEAKARRRHRWSIAVAVLIVVGIVFLASPLSVFLWFLFGD